MNIGNTKDLSNGLYLSVDWLSWTVTELDSVHKVISMMGFKLEDFKVLPQA